MASDLEKTEARVLSHVAEITTYTYDKNRRFPIEAGTRAANVLVVFGGGDHFRPGVQAAAMAVAVEQWEYRWKEPFPWNLAQFMVLHINIQVLVEVRVEPR